MKREGQLEQYEKSRHLELRANLPSVHCPGQTMTVPAGRTTRVAVYTAWKPQETPCTSTFAVVKVATRPPHGKLSNHLIDTTIPASRLDGSARCLGTPIKGLAVFYAPDRGFRGVDSFTLDVS